MKEARSGTGSPRSDEVISRFLDSGSTQVTALDIIAVDCPGAEIGDASARVSGFLAPEMVLFFTGPRYDRFLKRVLGDVTFNKLRGLA